MDDDDSDEESCILVKDNDSSNGCLHDSKNSLKSLMSGSRRLIGNSNNKNNPIFKSQNTGILPPITHNEEGDPGMAQRFPEKSIGDDPDTTTSIQKPTTKEVSPQTTTLSLWKRRNK
jgi:hypothetical protein